MRKGLTLITATGDRAEAFALCEKYIARQTFDEPFQWVVVDDGIIPTKVTREQTYVRRIPEEGEGAPTLNKNLLLALDYVEGDKILFIEDDDWYAPEWLSVMNDLLENYGLVGEGNAYYYNVAARRYKRFKNSSHASLCQTGMVMNEGSLIFLREILEKNPRFADVEIWEKWGGSGYIFMKEGAPLCVGIKGMPGRKGIGAGHNPDNLDYDDVDGGILKGLIGGDYRNYSAC